MPRGLVPGVGGGVGVLVVGVVTIVTPSTISSISSTILKSPAIITTAAPPPISSASRRVKGSNLCCGLLNHRSCQSGCLRVLWR